MKILVTAATETELKLLEKKVSKKPALKKQIDFEVTGIGMTLTAHYLTKILTKRRYNLAVNIGLAGSFKKGISIGEVVNVSTDSFADLGAEDGNKFLTLAEIGLQGRNHFPFRDEMLFNSASKKYSGLRKFKKVNAISINTVHGNKKSIKDVVRKFHPDIETMEGAAFFYVCMMEKIPCVQLRAISNYVERRNKDNWNVPLALKNLTQVTMGFLQEMQK